MTLMNVQSRVSFDSNVSPTDETRIRSIISSVYNGSVTGQAAFEKMITDDRYLNFVYTQGDTQTLDVNPDFPPVVSNIHFDLDFLESLKMINQHGDFVDMTVQRAVTHELVHALFQTADMTYIDPVFGERPLAGDGLPTQYNFAGMDLVGTTVQHENTIMSELGSSDIRISYPDSATASDIAAVGLPSELTEGESIDIAILAGPLSGNVVNNIFTNSLLGSGDSTNDLVVGLSGREYIYTGFGDDHLRDGSGADVLDGGIGDDSFYLSNDGDADIVVVGEGYDYIVGGEANDRIVFRTELLGLNPAYANWTAPAPGLSSGTASIPLLGGFITYQSGTDMEAYYAAFSEGIEQTVHHFPEDPTDYYSYTVQHSAPALWDEFVSTDESEETDFPVEAAGFSIFYQKFEVDQGQNALYVEIKYWSGGSQSYDHLYIADFDNGDFGINFQDFSTFAVPTESGGGTLSYNTPSHVAYINNNGSYITVPARPSAPQPQPRLAPENLESVANPGQNSGDRISEHGRNLAAANQSVSAEIGTIGDHKYLAEHLADQTDHSDTIFSDYVCFNGTAAISLADIVANSNYDPGDTWYEPEPIGGLV